MLAGQAALITLRDEREANSTEETSASEVWIHCGYFRELETSGVGKGAVNRAAGKALASAAVVQCR